MVIEKVCKKSCESSIYFATKIKAETWLPPSRRRGKEARLQSSLVSTYPYNVMLKCTNV